MTARTRFERSGALVLLAASLMLGQGCTETVSTAPNEDGARPAGDQLISGVIGGAKLEFDLESYETVVTKTVRPGKVTIVSGSRYTLEFKEGSLTKQAEISISERHPAVVDVLLGPDGIQFGEPVFLTVNYALTSNDPNMAYHHGKTPMIYWMDEENGEWVEMPGWDNPTERTYTVMLTHFSRYAMRDGTGGWEGPYIGPVAGKNRVATQ